MPAIEEYRFTADWFGRNIDDWRKWLSHLVDQPGIRMVEIGCWEGRATVWLLGNVLTHDTARIDCIDVFERDYLGTERSPTDTYEKRFDYNMNLAQGYRKVTKHKGPSQEILRGFDLYSYDAIYIDGSHTASDALEDGVLSFRLLKSGGILIFDDYEWTHYQEQLLLPRIGVDAFLTAFDGQYDLLKRGYQVALRKR